MSHVNELRAPLAGFIAALAFPWLTALLPFTLRIVIMVAIALIGVGLWLRAGRTDAPVWAIFAGGLIFSAIAAAIWIALFSFSAPVSRLRPLVIYGVFSAAAVCPLLTTLLPVATRRLVPLAMVLTCASIALARPARRYEGTGPAIAELAAQLSSVRDTVAWVHEHIRNEEAPFTDRAEDTLRRGRGTSDAMANLLQKLLLAQDIPARIVYVEGGKKLHSLVEYRPPESARWLLADPQNNLLGEDFKNASGLDLLGEQARPDWPEAWSGYEKLFIHVPGRGYTYVAPEAPRGFYKL